METQGTVNLPRLQLVIDQWVRSCFGSQQAESHKVRGLRLLEETIEFAQAVGIDKEKAAELLEYVYNRPIGEPKQELGGVFITLIAAINSLNYDADDVLSKELGRILSKSTEHFAARNRNKINAGFGE